MSDEPPNDDRTVSTRARRSQNDPTRVQKEIAMHQTHFVLVLAKEIYALAALVAASIEVVAEAYRWPTTLTA